jgi:hypothetical protein
MQLDVDTGLLTDTADRLWAAVSVAREVSEHRGRLSALMVGCGSGGLESAADDFLGQWGYGMGLIVDDAEELATMLKAAAATYQEVEDRIARGLE